VLFVTNNNLVKLAIFKIASLTIWRNKKVIVKDIPYTTYKTIEVKELL